MDYEAISAKMFPEHDPAYGARLVQAVCEAAGVPEMEAQCAAMREALADLLALYYGIHPRGSDIRDASDEELEKRMKWLGPNIFRVGPVLAARKALREWEGVRG